MQKVNIIEKFNLFKDFWRPKLIGELNDQHIKLVKLQGEFIWHSHENEDELFIVIKGIMQIMFRDKIVELKEGELLIVPKGIEHKPLANEEVWVMLFEPSTTLNTGNILDERTKKVLDVI